MQFADVHSLLVDSSPSITPSQRALQHPLPHPPQPAICAADARLWCRAGAHQSVAVFSALPSLQRLQCLLLSAAIANNPMPRARGGNVADRRSNTKSAPQFAATSTEPMRFRYTGVCPQKHPSKLVNHHSIATFNLRGISDRWLERHRVLKQCIRDIDADVFCFQEVLTGSYAQDAELLGPLYAVYSCPAALVNLRQQGGLASMLAYTLDWLAHSRLGC